MDVVKGSDQAYVFAKMGPAIILGFIQRPNQEQWLGSKIVINGGEIGNRFALPAPFGEYLFRKALRVLDSQRTLSSKQCRIIAESYEKNKDRAITSGTMRAINADVEMFGVDAVFPPEDRDEEI